MPTGAFTEQLDLPLLLVIAFFLFFLALVYYLRSEDKREGYPLVSDRTRGTANRMEVVGFPPLPKKKAFLLQDGNVHYAPHPDNERELNVRNAYSIPGSPIMPLGDPLADGVGPASYALKQDKPFRTMDGHPTLSPLRNNPDYHLEGSGPELLGMPVYAADGDPVGRVKDLWVNSIEYFVRYVELEIDGRPGTMLAPFAFADTRKQRMTFGTLSREQLLAAPVLGNDEYITAREEDRLNAYFAGGTLYNKTGAQAPLL
ncbi:Photosynthetic reaction center H-chain [Fulvimarina pelagi HTCC2506]|uniref:Photosynthetic reaction center H-chain n=1 Tax=Fulvimarina pelagi HTCC2506 TaxID=314231 RepID=Q0FYS1_9HYPH|nr:photosynthetic reaction center subunit H [Fulvimarina pelagi]EAU40237.1 Photosynthetic reaction center H-chain [Fulvimarina pelagi HTCC2506]